MVRLWFETAYLPNGWADQVRFLIEGGLIVAVEAGVAQAPDDERHDIALPGLCNVHSHAFQRGMAGLTEQRGGQDDDFWSWRTLMYRFLDRLDPDDVAAISAQAYAEMLQTGFTRVGEFHYLHHDPTGAPYANLAEMAEQIAGAAATTGIGLTLLPVFYAHGGFGGASPTAGQRRFLNDLETFPSLLEASGQALRGLPDANLGVAPHSLRAVTPEELAAICADASDGPIHIHAAEQTREVDDSLAWSGQRPVAWLLDHAAVDERWCLIHATHLDRAETTRLAASGAAAGLCPITEANLGDGIFPAQAYLAAGGRFGIGSDSNVLIDPAQELRMLEYAQRLSHRRRNVLAAPARASTGASLFEAALGGGAQALGQSKVGLCVGASADIVSLPPGDPSLWGRHGDGLLDGWLFAGRGVVKQVWRAGKLVVRDGRHVQADAIARTYSRTLDKLLAA